MLVKCHIWLKMVERHRNRSCQKLFHFLLLMIFRSKVENQIPLRNALVRFFGILERSGRYLTLGYKIQWPLAMFFGKTVWLVWKDQRQTTFVRCYSSIIHCFFPGQRPKPIYWTERAWYIPVVTWCSQRCSKGSSCCLFFLVNCYCSPCSPQLKMASAWRLEKGYFPIIPKLHALCLASGALPLEGLFCLLSLLCFV